MRESPEKRAQRAEMALAIYLEPASVREVAERLEVSYGTAYALIKFAGGPGVFRARGTRSARTMNHGQDPEV